jgi:MFS superfamily sulfate permease-like transporter
MTGPSGTLPQEKQTVLGIYLTAKEAYEKFPNTESIARTPLIAGVNADEEHIRAVLAFSHFLPVGDEQARGSPGLLVYRFGAPFCFANASLFLDDVERLIAQAPTRVRWFVLDAQAMVDVDTSGAEVLRQAITLLNKQNITFAVSRADWAFRSWLGRYDLMELIDPGRFYPTNRYAAQAFRQSPDSPTAQQDSSAVDKRDEAGARCQARRPGPTVLR